MSSAIATGDDPQFTPRASFLATRGCLVAVGLFLAVVIFMIVRDVTAVPTWQKYPVDSAPGTVARFLEDLQDGSWRSAYHLTLAGATHHGSPAPSDFRGEYGAWSQIGHHIQFRRVAVRGQTASIIVKIGTEYGGHPGAGYTDWQRVQYRLVHRGRWLIAGWKTRELSSFPY